MKARNINFLIALLVCSATLPAPAAAQVKADFPNVLGGVVRSDKWIIRRKAGEEEFIGDVSYKNPFYAVSADWAMFRRKRGIVDLKGKVHGTKIEKTGAQTESFSHTATYNLNSNTALLKPKSDETVKVIHTDPKRGKWTADAKSAFFNEKKSTVILSQDVKIKGEEVSSLSKQAVYDYKAAFFQFTGVPVIWGSHNKSDFAITGDSATASAYYNDISITGAVKGWVRTTNEEYRKYGAPVGKH